MTNRKPLTAKQVREIASESGLPHAEFCIEQDESRFGTDRMKEAHAEFERLAREAFESAEDE